MTGPAINFCCYVKDRSKLGTSAFAYLFTKLGLDKACPKSCAVRLAQRTASRISTFRACVGCLRLLKSGSRQTLAQRPTRREREMGRRGVGTAPSRRTRYILLPAF